MSKQKQDKQGGGWQFPRPIEIIKCKEGNKEYMKERPARKPYGRIVKVCEFSLEAVAEFGDDDARAVWRLAKRAARDFLRVSWINTAIVTAAKTVNQIIYMVTGAGGFGCVGEYSGRKRKKMGTECTAAERLEIEANYAFFKEAMKKELEIFYSAFANKNNLFPPADKVKPRSIEELSPEEKAYYAKVGLMAEGMERHTLRKAIAAGETE